MGEAYLRARAGLSTPAPVASLGRPGSGDGFTSGDYSLGLFHHDASESAIELLRHEPFREGAAGSLLWIPTPSWCWSIRRSRSCTGSPGRTPRRPSARRRGTFLSWNVLAVTMLRELAPEALGTGA